MKGGERHRHNRIFPSILSRGNGGTYIPLDAAGQTNAGVFLRSAC
nr:MAG TPA: hypothetical protein [Caudoviricetes sp.]DAW75511.1 MAG TPA: hypothetical protein [Caudoviricetes sp.]